MFGVRTEFDKNQLSAKVEKAAPKTRLLSWTTRRPSYIRRWQKFNYFGYWRRPSKYSRFDPDWGRLFFLPVYRPASSSLPAKFHYWSTFFCIWAYNFFFGSQITSSDKKSTISENLIFHQLLCNWTFLNNTFPLQQRGDISTWQRFPYRF